MKIRSDKIVQIEFRIESQSDQSITTRVHDLGYLCTCIHVYVPILYNTFITNRCALLWCGIIIKATLFTSKMIEDDYDFSYD